MPSQASGSRPPTPPSSPSIAMAGSPPFRRSFARHWRRSCSLVVLVAGCASRGAAHPPIDEDVVRRARLLRIEDTRRDEPAFLDSLLDDADPRARAAAALTAGRIGARGHRARLHRLAIDGDTAVASSALFALGLVKDTTALFLRAAAVRSSSPVALEGAWLLGELGDGARAAIVAALRDTAISATARGALLLAAARLRPVPAGGGMPWGARAGTA